MSQLQATFVQLLSKGLTYRRLFYLRRNFHHFSLQCLQHQQPHDTLHQFLSKNGENIYIKRLFGSKLNKRLTDEGNRNNREVDKSSSDFNEEDFGHIIIHETTKGDEVKEDFSNIANFDGHQNKSLGESSRNRKKLHHRVLTEDDIIEDQKTYDSVTDLNDHDLFGGEESPSVGTKSAKKKVHGQNKNLRRSDRILDNSPEQQQFRLKSKADSAKRNKRWSNTFGTLSNESEENSNHEIVDELEEKHHIRLSKKGRRFPPDWYGKKIEEYGKQGKVKDAIRVFDIWMLQNDRVMPNNFVISNLLTVLAKAGYTKKAFQVFNKIKKMGIKPNDYIYSALFNACANSPWREDGLQRAKSLLELMASQEITPNKTTFNSMIKAFAFCGDARTAFLLADKLGDMEKLSAETYSHMLMAAIADKTAGFWYAVQVWRWMLIKRVQPDIYLYNLMLRVIKECHIGSPTLTQQMLLPVNPAVTIKYFKSEKSERTDISEILELNTALPLPTIGGSLENSDRNPVQTSDFHQGNGEHSSDSKSLLLQDIPDQFISDKSKTHDSGNNFNSIVNLESTPVTEGTDLKKQLSVETPADVQLPNVLRKNVDLSSVVAIGDVSTPQDRFAMVGGLTGYLTDMEKNGVTPNIETFDQILSLTRPDEEEKLLEIMESKGVKPDIDFLTSLMYVRSLRKDYASAKDVLDLIAYHKLVPNMRTYCTLAMSCNSYKDGVQLIQNVKEAGMIPDIKVFGALIKTSFMNFQYKQMLLQEMEEYNIQPDYQLLRTIEIQMNKARKIILQKERAGEQDSKNYKWLDSSFEEFKQFYENWLRRMELDVPDHPWASFREKKETSEK